MKPITYKNKKMSKKIQPILCTMDPHQTFEKAELINALKEILENKDCKINDKNVTPILVFPEFAFCSFEGNDIVPLKDEKQELLESLSAFYSNMVVVEGTKLINGVEGESKLPFNTCEIRGVDNNIDVKKRSHGSKLEKGVFRPAPFHDSENASEQGIFNLNLKNSSEIRSLLEICNDAGAYSEYLKEDGRKIIPPALYVLISLGMSQSGVFGFGPKVRGYLIRKGHSGVDIIKKSFVEDGTRKYMDAFTDPINANVDTVTKGPYIKEAPFTMVQVDGHKCRVATKVKNSFELYYHMPLASEPVGNKILKATVTSFNGNELYSASLHLFPVIDIEEGELSS